MKRKFMKTAAVCMAAMMMLGSLAACGGSESEAPEETAGGNGTELTGNISLAGSTSMEKLCEAMSESFMQANPGVTVTVEYTGSSAGIESLVQGSVDIGNASRGLEDGEKESGAVENIVAIDGITVILEKSNEAADLTTEYTQERLQTGRNSAARMKPSSSSGARRAQAPEVHLKNCWKLWTHATTHRNSTLQVRYSRR